MDTGAPNATTAITVVADKGRVGTPKRALDRRDFPRLRASGFGVRYAICGHYGLEVPGFTTDVSCAGLSFCSPDTRAKVGDHLSLEIAVPGFDDPLYFLG